MVFSDSTNKLGIVEQTRSILRVDATQWPTWKIVNSVNNWLDMVTGYAIGADKRFQWDDTNHTDLPEGTADLTLNTSDFSFLTDEQNNKILTLLGVSRLDGGDYLPLTLVDRSDPSYDPATFGTDTGTPTEYDKIADNVIRLNRKVSSTVTNGLKFYFQRTPSYFAESDTTKTPGVSPLLHRGFVIASAYDGALSLGLQTLQALSVERQLEEEKMKKHFAIRNKDAQTRFAPFTQNNR